MAHTAANSYTCWDVINNTQSNKDAAALLHRQLVQRDTVCCDARTKMPLRFSTGSWCNVTLCVAMQIGRAHV